MSFEAQERSFQPVHLQLAAREWGFAGGEPVIALHGWLDNAATFDRLFPQLPELHAMALDFPGHGHSQHLPPGCRYHFIDNIYEVIGLADSLGWQRFSLLGHSMGAITASLVAATVPDRIRKLVLIEGTGPMSMKAEEAPQQLEKSVGEFFQSLNKRKPVYKTEDEAIKARMHGIGGLSYDASAILTRRGLMPFENGFTWRADPRLRVASALRMTEPQVFAFLQRIAAPTCLIAGKQGFIPIDPEKNPRVAQLRQLSSHLIEGNHHLHLDGQSEAVAEIVRAFFHN